MTARLDRDCRIDAPTCHTGRWGPRTCERVSRFGTVIGTGTCQWDWDTRDSIPAVPRYPPSHFPAKSYTQLRRRGKFTIQKFPHPSPSRFGLYELNPPPFPRSIPRSCSLPRFPHAPVFYPRPPLPCATMGTSVSIHPSTSLRLRLTDDDLTSRLRLSLSLLHKSSFPHWFAGSARKSIAGLRRPSRDGTRLGR